MVRSVLRMKDAPQSGWIESGVDEAAFLGELRALRPLNAPDSMRAFFRLYAERHGKTRFGEKTPRYVESIDVIAGALPEARFIHMIRDGRDVALSTNKRLVELRGTTPVPIKKMAKRWRGRIIGARRAAFFCIVRAVSSPSNWSLRIFAVLSMAASITSSARRALAR